MLKILILVLFAAVLMSLFSGLAFLIKDSTKDNSSDGEPDHARRTLHALGVRVVLATALLLTIFYGFYSGELTFGKSAPWHERSSVTTHDTLSAG